LSPLSGGCQKTYGSKKEKGQGQEKKEITFYSYQRIGFVKMSRFFDEKIILI